MSKLLNDDVKEMLTNILKDMVDDVYVKVYVDTLTCETCTETHQLMDEISELSDKIHYDLVETHGDKTVWYHNVSNPGCT